MRRSQSNAAEALTLPMVSTIKEMTGDATWEIRPRTGEHFLSARSRELLGITVLEPVSIQRLVAAVFPVDRDRWKNAMEGLLDPEGTGEVDVDFRSAASPSRWLTASGRALFDGLTPVRVVGSLRESGPQLNVESTLLGDICQEVVEEAKLDHPNYPIQLERWDDVPGEWDAELVADVARNLIWNAIIHGDVGSPIIVSAVTCGDQALMIVASLGQALPLPIREHLLDPDHHDVELSPCPVLCRTLDIVRAHGGRIELSSEDDATVFHVWLPKSQRAGAMS